MFEVTPQFLTRLTELIKTHHKLYRFPVKGEMWEDLFDTCINQDRDFWNAGNHDKKVDVVCESTGLTFQNKAGSISNGELEWSGHRLTRFDTIEDKLSFLETSNPDYYVMLSRDKKEWASGVRKYYFIIFKPEVIDYSKLQWSETKSRNGMVSGWSGVNPEVNYTAKIVKSMSDQLWTKASMDLFDVYEIEV